MPTRRTRRSRPRIETATPAWARRLLAGEPPTDVDSEDGQALIGWYFFHDHVEGLPDPDTPAGRKVWAIWEKSRSAD